MLFESVRELQDRLDELPPPATLRTHLSATVIGSRLYGALVADYTQDQSGFEQSVKSLDWRMEYVGHAADPMFALLFTPKGMMTLTKFPEGEYDPMVRAWLDVYAKEYETPWQRFKQSVRNWFK